MLSARQQMRNIYALYCGGDTRPEAHDPEDYADPWSGVLARLSFFYGAYAKDIGKTVGGVDWRTHYHEELLDCLAPAARLLRTHPHDVISLLADASKRRRQFVPGSEITPVEPTWLWNRWVPRRFLTLLGAAPKTGKSWFGLDLARVTISGGAWPDGQQARGGGTVVWVEAEGVLDMTLHRAQRMGVDLRRLWPLKPPKADILDLTGGDGRDDLIELTQQVQPDLIVIDSLSGITAKGENNIEDVRRLLAFLVTLAEEHDAALVLIHHLKKLDRAQLSLPGLGLADFRGSGHITAAPRSILGLSVQSPAGGALVKNGPRRLEVVAAALCQAPDPLGMTMQDQDGGRMVLVYGEAPTAEVTTVGESCADWVIEVLQANGPMRPKDVLDLAETEGYERSMVFRARRKLLESGVVVNTLGEKHPKNLWKLVDAPDEGDDE